MRPVVTPAEMGEADRRTISAGTPEAVLVERAGGAVARHALRMLGGAYGRRVVVVCGAGNNGADGVVAARRLRARGVGVDEFALGRRRRRGRAAPRARRAPHLAIDAMFGTGFRGALDGDAALRRRARSPRPASPTLAVDIPSGVDGTTGEVRGAAVRADETVCFAALEAGPAVRARAHARRARARRRHRDRRRRRRTAAARARAPPISRLPRARGRRAQVVVGRAGRRRVARA